MTVIPPIEFQSYDFVAGNESDFVYDPTQLVLTATNGVSSINTNPMIIPVIQNREAIPLTWIEYVTIATTTPEQLRMQVSINGYEWWYYDEVSTIWAKAPTVSTVANTMPVSASITNLPEFTWEVGDGDFYWRFWLLGTNLTNISVKYKKYYASLKDCKGAMAQFLKKYCRFLDLWRIFF